MLTGMGVGAPPGGWGMLYLYIVYVVATAGLLVGGVVEGRRHRANLERIGHRVHVNGIRGKSSTTRLCAGALRGGGLTAVAKTTGTAARFIHPDGFEEPVRRKFDIPNISEQIGIIRRAAKFDPDALVIECMAVQPTLQKASQEQIVHGTIGVLTNVREDHLAEMGPTLADVARSLSSTMPRNGVCVTAERRQLPILRREAVRRSCRLVSVDPHDVTDEEMAPFKYVTFKENVAVALAVAAEMGVGRQQALEGMYAAQPDPGVAAVEEFVADRKLLRVANVFAANDPESTIMNVEQLLSSGAIRPPIFTVINCRPDRMERNRQMGAIVPDLRTDKLFLIGHPVRSAREGLPAGWGGPVVELGGSDRSVTTIWRQLVAHTDVESSVVAIGNIHGLGETLLEHLGMIGSLR